MTALATQTPGGEFESDDDLRHQLATLEAMHKADGQRQKDLSKYQGTVQSYDLDTQEAVVLMDDGGEIHAATQMGPLAPGMRVMVEFVKPHAAFIVAAVNDVNPPYIKIAPSGRFYVTAGDDIFLYAADNWQAYAGDDLFLQANDQLVVRSEIGSAYVTADVGDVSLTAGDDVFLTAGDDIIGAAGGDFVMRADANVILVAGQTSGVGRVELWHTGGTVLAYQSSTPRQIAPFRGLGSARNGSPPSVGSFTTPLFFQAGSTGVTTDVNAIGTVTFPAAFPNGVLCVVATNGDDTNQPWGLIKVRSSNINNFTFKMSRVDTLGGYTSVGVICEWIAIGF